MDQGERANRKTARLLAWIAATKWTDFTVLLPIAAVILVILGTVVWFVAPRNHAFSIPPLEGDIFELIVGQSILNTSRDIAFGYTVNMAIQLTLIVTALLATVLASVTTEETAADLKKWSMLLTAITAALATFISTFHIRENIDTFVNVANDLSMLQIRYMTERAAIEKPVDNKKPTKELLELQQKWMPEYVRIRAIRMRTYANAGAQWAPSSGQQQPGSDKGK